MKGELSLLNFHQLVSCPFSWESTWLWEDSTTFIHVSSVLCGILLDEKVLLRLIFWLFNMALCLIWWHESFWFCKPLPSLLFKILFKVRIIHIKHILILDTQKIETFLELLLSLFICLGLLNNLGSFFLDDFLPLWVLSHESIICILLAFWNTFDFLADVHNCLWRHDCSFGSSHFGLCFCNVVNKWLHFSCLWKEVIRQSYHARTHFLGLLWMNFYIRSNHC